MSEATPTGPHGYSAEKQALLARLKRVEGQVRGIARMVDEDTYCIDVLTQISALPRRCRPSQWVCWRITCGTA